MACDKCKIKPGGCKKCKDMKRKHAADKAGKKLKKMYG